MKDILIGDTGIVIENNDMVIGYSNYQHQEHLLVQQKGELKQDPDVGAGIENYLRDDEIQEMTSEVATQFTKDGMTVNRINYNEEAGDLDYDANYPS